MTRALPFTVLVILDRDAAARAGRSLVDQGLRALDATGAEHAALLVRIKDRPAAESADAVRALRTACTARSARLLVHTFVDVALTEGADGVHLSSGSSVSGASASFTPASSDDPRTARSSFDAAARPDALVGWSRHASDTLTDDDARLAACSYVTLSPFARPHSKPDDTRAVLGVSGFAARTRAAHVPVIALGGVDEKNVASARRAGASAVAVLEGVCGAHDPARALDAVVDAWTRD